MSEAGNKEWPLRPHFQRYAIEGLIPLDGFQAVVAVSTDPLVDRKQEEVQAITVGDQESSRGVCVSETDEEFVFDNPGEPEKG